MVCDWPTDWRTTTTPYKYPDMFQTFVEQINGEQFVKELLLRARFRKPSWRRVERSMSVYWNIAPGINELRNISREHVFKDERIPDFFHTFWPRLQALGDLANYRQYYS